MNSKKELVLGNNVFIHFHLLKFERGMDNDKLLSRELWKYLRQGYYRLSTDGQLVVDKALDLATHNFVICGYEFFKEIANYIRRSNEVFDSVLDLRLNSLPVIPLAYYHKHYDRGGKFGLVCYKHFPIYLVSMDEKEPDMTVEQSALVAVNLLSS